MTTPYLIAECAKEHGGDIDIAKKYIKSARDAGFNCVKFQSYDLRDLNKAHPNYDRNYQCHLHMDTLKELNDYSKKCGIDFHCSAFSKSVIEPLSKFTSRIKIPSTFLTYTDFVFDCIDYFDDIHISTGMHSRKTIDGFRNIYEEDTKNKLIIYYHCISDYNSSTTKGLKLNRIATDFMTGFSYHGRHQEAVMQAINFGASLIELHYTMSDINLSKFKWSSSDIKTLLALININNEMTEDNGEPSDIEKENFHFYSEEFMGLKNNVSRI